MYVDTMHIGDACGEGRIPYSDPTRMKCIVVGLPHGLSFKQPAKYTAPELRLIQTNKENINFLPVHDSVIGQEVHVYT